MEVVSSSYRKAFTVRALLLIFFVLLAETRLQSQETLWIKGVVTDRDDHPVAGVRVFLASDSKRKVFTNAEGIYQLEMRTLRPDTLKFETVMFQKTFRIVTQKQIDKGLQKGGITLDKVILEDRQLPAYTVRPDLPDTLVGTKEYFVSDFAFDAAGNLILLTYEQNLQRGSVVRLMNSQFQETSRFTVPELAISLETDWRQRVHLICENKVFWLSVDADFLVVLEEDRQTYFRNIAPIIDTVQHLVYYSNYSDVYPAFDYYEYNVRDSVHRKLLNIEDSETMEFYRAEFKYLDNRQKVEMANLQIQTGIDKEIWAGALYYTKSLYFDPVYAPLFKLNDDSVLIFDHYKNRMFIYSPGKGFVDSTRISYHLDERRSGWEEPLIQDPVTRKIYAVFQRSGFTYLYEIDKLSGAAVKSCRLTYKYVEGLQIRAGLMLYIYRPFESNQKKFLYSEKF